MYRFEARYVGRSQGNSSTKQAAHNTGKSAGKRASAVASAAYLSRSEMTDQRTGRSWDYSDHFGGAGAVLMLPENSPAWMHDRSKLWNHIEKIENRKDSMLTPDFIGTMPYNLTREQQWAAAKDFAYEQFVAKGKPADLGMHVYGEPWKASNKATVEKVEEWKAKGYPFYEIDKAPKNDAGPHVAIERGRRGQMTKYYLHQPHIHIMTTFRTVDPDSPTSFSKHKETVTKGHWKVEAKVELLRLRKAWADNLNKHFEMAGLPDRVDHRSLSDQGIQREPEPKKGPVASKMERDDRGDESHAVLDWKAAKDRNAERKQLAERSKAIEAEIYDLTLARLKQMQQGVRKVEFTDQQFADRQQNEKDLLAVIGQQRESIARFESEYEEEQKRLARTAAPREEEMQSRLNRGDVADASDRWAKAMHDSYNSRVKPEESLAMAVGVEAEMFRKEQQAVRDQEAKEEDPAKKKLLEYQRQIEACDYMALGKERCATLAGFIVGRPDNEISNRDRDQADELRAIGAKLREDQGELRQTIDQGMYDEVDAFLKDKTRGLQPTRTQRDDREEETKERFYGLGDLEHGEYENRPFFRRDLPPGAEPVWRDLGKDEIMPPGAYYQINLETGRTQVRQSPSQETEQARPVATEKEEKAAREEQTDSKQASQSREDTTFDEDLAARFREAEANTGRSRGSGMSR